MHPSHHPTRGSSHLQKAAGVDARAAPLKEVKPLLSIRLAANAILWLLCGRGGGGGGECGLCACCCWTRVLVGRSPKRCLLLAGASPRTPACPARPSNYCPLVVWGVCCVRRVVRGKEKESACCCRCCCRDQAKAPSRPCIHPTRCPLLDTPPLPCHPYQRARSQGQASHAARAATGRRGSSLAWVTARG